MKDPWTNASYLFGVDRAMLCHVGENTEEAG